MANINLIPGDNESLSTLFGKSQEGYSVLRSAHVGNARAYNLALAGEGIDMMLVDHTITGRDGNYRPEAVIRDGEITLVAELGQLTFRTMAVIDGEQDYLDRLHANSLREAFKSTSVTTNIEYLRRNERIVGEIAKIATGIVPELFARVVPRDEVAVRNDRAEGLRLARAGAIMQLVDDPRKEQGVLLPNEVDIAANFAIEAIASGRDKQYHISGPDMVNYMTRPKSKDDKRTPLNIVNMLYTELSSSASFRGQLPEEINVVLVPGAHARFATTMERGSDLDKLLLTLNETNAELTAINARRGEFFRSPESKDREARKLFLARSDADRRAISAVFGVASEQCADLFVGPTDAPYISQYDVLAEGGLYVPESIRAMTMAELAGLGKELAQLRKGAS